jgi:hypothetical protein
LFQDIYISNFIELFGIISVNSKKLWAHIPSVKGFMIDVNEGARKDVT